MSDEKKPISGVLVYDGPANFAILRGKTLAPKDEIQVADLTEAEWAYLRDRVQFKAERLTFAEESTPEETDETEESR